MSRLQNGLLLLGVIGILAFSLWWGGAGDSSSGFVGTDDKARDMVLRIAPHYEPWVGALFEPVSEGVTSLLFLFQALLGIGVLGYGFRRMRLRTRERAESEEINPPPADVSPCHGMSERGD